MSISPCAPLPLSLYSLLAALPTTVPTTRPALDPLTTPPLGPTTQPAAPIVFAFVAVLLLLTVIAIALFIVFHVWNPRTVIGPRRLPEHGKTATLLLSLGVGLFAWLGTMTFYGAYRGAQLQRAGVKDVHKHLQDSLTPKDLAVLSTAPQLTAFALMVLIVVLAGDSLASRLGLSLRKLPRGVGAGVLAFLCIFPLVWWGMIAIEFWYNRIGFRHPAEHELLKSFGEAHKPRVILGLVFGATVCAPLFEELLFRGHLQTLLRQVFLKIAPSSTAPPAVGTAAPPAPAPTSAPPIPWTVAPYPPPFQPGQVPAGWPPPPPPYGTRPVPSDPLPLAPQTKSWPSWLAILITALIFGLVHPLWMAPMIFLLALGLGYIYERTGILWASITVHLLFNSTETLQYYLLTMHAH